VLYFDLQKRAFRPGEIVCGRLSLDLDEPRRADRLIVGIHATEDRFGSARTRYRVERDLAGKGIYRGGSYEFELPVPELTRPTLAWRIYAFLAGVRAVTEITVG